MIGLTMVTHDDVMEQIEKVSDSPATMIPLVLMGYAGAVLGIVSGFGLLCMWACHR